MKDVILSFDDYNKLLASKPKRTILEAAEEFRRKTAGMFTNEDIDKIFDVRDHTPDSYESHVFDGVFEESASRTDDVDEKFSYR